MNVLESIRADAYLRALRRRLPEAKVAHCISVAEHLCGFAGTIGLDPAQAATAGLLHDYSRMLSNAEMLRCAALHGLPVSALQRERPKLLHGPVGAAELRRDLGIDDPEVYEAIYWHTTGTPGLCRLGQALYLADFSEPMRAYAEAARTRQILFEQGFDAALRYVAETKLGLHQRKGTTAPESLAFAAWVREEYRA